MKKIKEIFKLKNFINLNALKEGEVTNEEEMLRLDAQGRHRSEWCYAAYDGRVPIRVDDMFLGYSGMKKIKKMNSDLLEALKKGTERQWVAAYKDP